MRALLTPYAATCDAARLEEGARAVEISLRAKHHLMLFLRLPLNRVHSLAKGRACLLRDPSRVTRRGVAQPGRALSSGGRGRRFESSFPDHSIRANSKLPQGGRKTAEFWGFSERRNLEIFQFHPQNSQYFFHNLWTGDGLGHRILLFLEPGTGNHSFQNATADPRLQTAIASRQLAGKSAGFTVAGTGNATTPLT